MARVLGEKSEPRRNPLGASGGASASELAQPSRVQAITFPNTLW